MQLIAISQAVFSFLFCINDQIQHHKQACYQLRHHIYWCDQLLTAIFPVLAKRLEQAQIATYASEVNTTAILLGKSGN